MPKTMKAAVCRAYGTPLAIETVPVPEPARELVTFLLESYAQDLERSQRQQAYESYYALRSAEDQDEEIAILADFAFVDAEATTEDAA